MKLIAVVCTIATLFIYLDFAHTQGPKGIGFMPSNKEAAQIEAEQEMVNANKKLIVIFEQKTMDKIPEV